VKKIIGAEVKKLSNQIKKLDTKINNVQATVNVEVTELKDLRARRQAFENRLTHINDDELTLSDHALLRYLERVLNIDVESYRKNILIDVNKFYDRLQCNSKIPINDEHGKYNVVIRNRNIVSIIVKEEQ